jgi:endonuclease YncB( thermonuclease family)
MDAIATITLAATQATANPSAGESGVQSLFAFGLLVASLLIFLLSSLQFRLLPRTIIWAAGAGLLAVSSLIGIPRSAQMRETLRNLQSLVQSSSGDASYASVAFNQNISIIQDHLVLAFSMFAGVGALAGLLALVAFTPGEAVERATRPLSLIVLGAIAGSLASLSIVAVGFGDYPARQVFYGRLSDDAIHDADTFKFGEVTFRPFGVDAPELNQQCVVRGAKEPCGTLAREFLVDATKGSLLICEHIPGKKDAYNRELAQCNIAEGSNVNRDIGALLVQSGNAISDKAGTYREEEKSARDKGLGIWRGCFLDPKIWRDSKAKQVRNDFLSQLPSDEQAMPGVFCGP